MTEEKKNNRREAAVWSVLALLSMIAAIMVQWKVEGDFSTIFTDFSLIVGGCWAFAWISMWAMHLSLSNLNSRNFWVLTLLYLLGAGIAYFFVKDQQYFSIAVFAGPIVLLVLRNVIFGK